MRGRCQPAALCAQGVGAQTQAGTVTRQQGHGGWKVARRSWLRAPNGWKESVAGRARGPRRARAADPGRTPNTDCAFGVRLSTHFSTYRDLSESQTVLLGAPSCRRHAGALHTAAASALASGTLAAACAAATSRSPPACTDAAVPLPRSS